MSCSPEIMPSLSKRWIVEGATRARRRLAVFLGSSGSSSGGANYRRGAVEVMPVDRRAALPVEDAGDHGIGIMHC